MSAILQIISHEYRRYIFTTGFLLFLLFVPAMMLLGASAVVLQEATQTVKSFVVIDRDGGWTDVIDAELATDEEDSALELWDNFVIGLEATGVIDPSALPSPYKPGPRTDEERQAFFDQGGLEAAQEALGEISEVQLPPLETPRQRFRRVDIDVALADDADAQAVGDAFIPYLRGEADVPGGGRLNGVLLIPEGFGDDPDVRASFVTDNIADTAIRSFASGVLGTTIRTQAFLEAGLAPEELERIRALRPGVSVVKAGSTGEDGERLKAAIEFGVPLALTYLLFVVVISVGGMMLTNTIEEKSNKIVEMLLSSVSAGQLMAGKLIGLALVGATPMLLFSTIGFTILTVFGAADETFGLIREVLVASPLIPLFFVYFLLGYLLYASIYLAIGALCESIQDTQTLSTPLTILMVAPAPFITSLVEDPNGLFARIFTWIPFYTHTALMLRLSGSPPLWELIGATAMLVVVVFLMLTFMGRIYRAGILQSGGNANFKTFFAAARASDETSVR